MTCKDCLHVDVCKMYAELHNVEARVYRDGAEKCKCFESEKKLAEMYFDFGVHCGKQPQKFVHNKNYIHWRGEERLPLSFLPEWSKEMIDGCVIGAKTRLIQDVFEKTKANKGWFQFTVSEATAEEKEQCADTFQRADGTHIMRGKHIEREKIIEMLKGKPYKISLDVYVPTEEAESDEELP